MTAMAAGDPAFLFTFTEHFGAALAGHVRRILTEMGRLDVVTDGDEVDGLVQDAALFIYDIRSRRRPHWTSVLGLGLFVAAMIAKLTVAGTPAWAVFVDAVFG